MELKSSGDKNARHEPYWGGGEKSLLCDPGSEKKKDRKRESTEILHFLQMSLASCIICFK